MSAPIVERLRVEFDQWTPDPTFDARIEASSTIEDLLAALGDVLPRNLCLTNRNIPDSTIVPLETTMGELRQIAASIAKAKGGAQ
jgi:hypothetical protein